MSGDVVYRERWDLVDRFFERFDEQVEEVAMTLERRFDAAAPARNLARIRRSSTVVQDGDGRGGARFDLVMRSEPDAFFWRFHEYGTAKMPARPALAPAALAAHRDLEQRIGRLGRALS